MLSLTPIVSSHVSSLPPAPSAVVSPPLLEVELEEKLGECLDECQVINDIPQLLGDSGLVDVDNFPEYTPEPDSVGVTDRGLEDEMHKFTIGEVTEMARRVKFGADPHQHPGKQAFYDLRRTLWILGHIYERGLTRALLQDRARSSTIAIKV